MTDVRGAFTEREQLYESTHPKDASDELLSEWLPRFMSAVVDNAELGSHRWDGQPPSLGTVRKALTTLGFEGLPVVGGRFDVDEESDDIKKKNRPHNLFHELGGKHP
jgi:hypothetical protein